jgi:hypothetical protein
MLVMPCCAIFVTPAKKKCNIQSTAPILRGVFLRPIQHAMVLPSTTRLIAGFARSKLAAVSIYSLVHVPSVLAASLMLFARHSSRRNDVYNILWAVVFGFATLNILSLAARRFEPNRRGLTFGELMAVLIVLLSIFLLGWELLSVFRIFPIKLQR